LIQANEEFAVWGRGTGKSEGLIAPRTFVLMNEMPRSLGGLVAATYQQHLTRTLPAIVRGWESLGLKRDRDWFIGRTAPKNWGWDLPYFMPLKTEYFIHFRTGAGIVLISQDRPGSGNGLSLDWVAGDEAKFLNKDRLDNEVMPAMRGNFDKFGHLSVHQSVLFATDMPTMPSGEWILEKEHEMNQNRIDLIVFIQQQLHTKFEALKSGTLSEETYRRYEQECSSLMKELNLVRKGNPENGVDSSIYYSEAGSIENVEVLQASWFKKQQRNLSKDSFDSSILNLRRKKVRNSFYPSLSEAVHAYTEYNYEFLQSKNHDFEELEVVDSRQDLDCDPKTPLEIAMDYGGSFNCIVTGQRWPFDFRFINNFHVDYPKKIKDVVLLFKQYYQHHECKVVTFYYDHTSIGTNALSVDTYATEVMKLLKDDAPDMFGAWTVKPIYIGQQPGYETRFKLWQAILDGTDERYPRFRYHKVNCEEWSTSCFNAPAKEGRNGTEKIKSSEKTLTTDGSYATPQVKATHLSDAGDSLLFGHIEFRRSYTAAAPGGAMMG
jgi:hypothetical protein